ncbi:hypothetical protein [Bacteroides sp. UBA939]|uniref:hypothetical protein n=1 Tax=Bacteroides sp. UBA939 TaxID=1946092 RepID=UPI0025BD277D|nr:hypothetical protein [Bacteroides sp. UBA939]
MTDLESEKLIESFFDTYKSKGAEMALNEIFATNKYFSMMHSRSVGEVKSKLVSCTDSIGEYCGHEIVVRRVIGESLNHYSCIVKYEVQPIRLMLTLYKPQDTWVLFNFQFSTDFTDELDESAKFYYIE